jgi:uncharacterized protein (DUF488 family)
MRIYTAGHSTRPFEEFVALLRARAVTHLCDVRTVPRSRRHPQYSQEVLRERLAACGIGYTHLRDLGGLRQARPDSPNTAWQEPAFRGYADHMQTPAFRVALDELLHLAADRPTAVMCAEADWQRCHRRLLSDALVLRGAEVVHIGAGPPSPHRLSPFIRERDGTPWYPGLV